MAFRKKYEQILRIRPDLLIIQECENESKLKSCLESIEYNEIIWYGNNPNKGIGILSFNNIKIELGENHNPEFEYIIPLKLKTKKRIINLFVVWAKDNKTEWMKRYIGQVWGAINYYSNYLDDDTILIGDFNSNAIWDKKKRIANHSDVVKYLNDKKIISIYHEKNNCEHGMEKHPTFYLTKKREKEFHIDYCFASKNIIASNTKIEVGEFEDWIKLSDHMPIIINGLANEKM